MKNGEFVEIWPKLKGGASQEVQVEDEVENEGQVGHDDEIRKQSRLKFDYKGMVDQIKVAHINIRSIEKNRCALDALVVKEEFDILAITETWSNKEKLKFPTHNYEVIVNPAENN